MAALWRRRVGMASVLGLVLTASSAWSAPPQDVPKDINKTFTNPNLDVKNYVERFENESREVFAQRVAIADVLGLKPGMVVADVGAGTGLFTRLFANRVAPDGKVMAVDIAPAFLSHIAEVAKAQGQAEIIQTVQGTQNDTGLTRRTVDMIFLCDTYHHFEDPKLMLRSMRRALKPGGKLVLIEFDRNDKASDFIKEHVRASKEEFCKEIEQAGFKRVELGKTPELSENFMVMFEKVRGERDGQAPAKGADGSPR